MSKKLGFYIKHIQSIIRTEKYSDMLYSLVSSISFRIIPLRFLIFLYIVFSLATVNPCFAQRSGYHIDPGNKHAWSSSAGWINHRMANEYIMVYDSHLEGYAWAENIGWIRLGTHTGGGYHYYANTDNTNYGINNDGGVLSGYAWSTSAGWINFNPSYGGVMIDPITGDFSGYAWSENLGWISFSGIAEDLTPYKVKALYPEFHEVTLLSAPDDIGVVLFGAGGYSPGTEVHISAYLDNGYQFMEWTGAPDDIALLEDPVSNTTFFTMPDRDITFTAVFEEDVPEFEITIVIEPAYIFEEADPLGDGFYEPGEIVEVSVQEVDKYIFSGWTSEPEIEITDPNALNIVITMPESDLILTAHYDYEIECTLKEALDNPDLTWTTTTEPVDIAEWYCQTEEWYYGGSAAQSGAIGHNESTSMHTTVYGPGILSFWWKIDSEANYDILDFYVNGALIDWISGDIDWHETSYELPEGENILTWTYSKDDSISVGQDAGWVDLVMFEPGYHGPDASISPGDITYSPSNPLPGDTVEITARVRNIGTEGITSGKALIFYSMEPGEGLTLISSENFGSISAGDYKDIIVDWYTGEHMDPMTYIITVMLVDILPYDINPDNNAAYTELALPVELAYFSAVGILNRANLRWMTLSERDNLGFNLYRMNISSAHSFITFPPVKINESLIPGQGTTSSPNSYTFVDYGINRLFNYVYILEAVSTCGDTCEYRTQMMRIGKREIILE